MEKATPRQGFALFLATGYDVRKINLDKGTASDLIEKADKQYAEQIIQQIANMQGVSLTRKTEGKGFKTKEQNDFQQLFDQAHQAAMDAANKLKVEPMIVQQHKHVADDQSPVIKEWVVPDGPCGFAWIKINPGNCQFANWLKKNNLGQADKYSGGVRIWVSQFGQSLARKTEYATVFANVINEKGLKGTLARPCSQID